MKVLRSHLSSYNATTFQQNEKITLESIGNIEYYCGLDSCVNPDILITNTHTIPEKLSNLNWQNIKLIIHPNSGYDNFSPEWVKNCNIPIVLGNKIRAQAVINYTLAALFTAMSPLKFVTEWDKSRLWQRDLLSQKNVLIVGHGLIGSTVGSVIKPLVNELHIFDPYKNYTLLPSQNIDIIILCASLNQTSDKLINHSFLDAVLRDKNKFILINGARGGLINEDDLLEYLKGTETQAYLDVFEKEPNSFEKFKSYSNIYKTSHIAGVYNSLDYEIINFSKTIITEFIENKEQFFKTHTTDLLLSKYHHGILL